MSLHRHSLDRLNAINDYLNNKKDKKVATYSGTRHIARPTEPLLDPNQALAETGPVDSEKLYVSEYTWLQAEKGPFKIWMHKLGLTASRVFEHC